jgi:homoserine dehydrogenase
MRQYGHAETSAPVLIVTHNVSSAAVEAALEAMESTGVLASAPVALRIEEV